MEVYIMKESVQELKGKTSYIREFDSLSEFEGYITNTPLNKSFQWKKLSSTNGSYGFTQTHSYEEATKLFKDGWNSMAQEITNKLKVIKNQSVDEYVQKVMYDVVGFQASVPRYLQGLPTSMVNKKQVVVKQKVITLNKDVSYNCGITTEQIVKASIETLQLIKKIEAQGVRVNLNLVWGVEEGKTREVVKIRLKSANERLNISKLAFPLVHPSMLRRLLFRYMEVAPTIHDGYTYAYGYPLDGLKLKQYCKDEYVLPRLFNGNIASLGDLGTICNLTDKIVNGKNDAVKIN
jgi:hypothetical protein